MSLFDSLEDKFHCCGMVNLYTRARFCKAAYQHDKKTADSRCCTKKWVWTAQNSPPGRSEKQEPASTGLIGYLELDYEIRLTIAPCVLNQQ